jgi:glycosyltransferase involved in cell wall biosynthesis
VTAGPGPASDEDRETPVIWRLAALGLLAGGVIAGLRLSAGGARRATPLGIALVGAALPIARASRRPPLPPRPPAIDPAAAPPTFSVVVAGRNESAVLPLLVDDIAGQDWRDEDGTPRFELIVIDDRSIDGTGRVVLEAAAAAGIGAVTRVLHRRGSNLPDGKGAALTAAQPDQCRNDVVVVLDADARVAPGFLRILAAYVAAGAPAVTARRRVRAAKGSTLAGMQADEQTLDGELQRGRWALGGCSEFRGNGIVIERDLLAALGGWRAPALTEDLDLASRLAARRGLTVAWAIDAEVWEEPVTSWSGLWRQRCRWAEGAVRRLFEHGAAVLGSPFLSRRAKLDFATYAGQLAAPPVILGTLVGAVRGRPAAAVTIVGCYLVAAGGLAWDALRWESSADGTPLDASERTQRAVRTATFSGIWLAALPAALWRLATRRGRLRYDKMAHVGPQALSPR